MKKLPFEDLKWIKIYEWVAGDPRSKIPWDDQPQGMTNRPLYQLLVNDRDLVLRLLDALYAVRDIQEVFNRFSPQHTDVVIKRSGTNIPGIGVLPTSVHSDIDARFSSVGQVVRQLRNRKGRCSYTDHADFHEDIPHRDNPGHEDFHGDSYLHGDTSRVRTYVQHRPLWVARYLPSQSSGIYVPFHADHVDTHLDISFSGTAPSRAVHADRTVSGFERDFTYIPFWNTTELQRYLQNGVLPPTLAELEPPRPRQDHYDLSNVLVESPVQFRQAVHGDHTDVNNPLKVNLNSVSSRGERNEAFGQYPSFYKPETEGGLTLVITESLGHQDYRQHSDSHQDAGFGFHGDLPHHDSHADEFIHCDFTAPHLDYTSHTDYQHQDETRVESTHADHTDHADVDHQDQTPGVTNPCIHTDYIAIHSDIPRQPHLDKWEHVDYWSGSDPVPHGDAWGSHIFHSDSTISPVHFDHVDYGTYPIWYIQREPGVFSGISSFGLQNVYVNPHYDYYSLNNHSDHTITFPPGIIRHLDHADNAEYTYYHQDTVTVRFAGLLDHLTGVPSTGVVEHNDHGDVTTHGDKAHGDYIYMGQQHTDTPASTGGRVHGDTITYQDAPERPHSDHSDHGDLSHCDYPLFQGHLDLHNDMPHANYTDHANSTVPGTTWHSDVPHYDHLDHGDY